MSMMETLSDENNSFLSSREITCDFKGLGGKLKKLEAIEMITKEFKLDGKIVIPIKFRIIPVNQKSLVHSMFMMMKNLQRSTSALLFLSV